MILIFTAANLATATQVITTTTAIIKVVKTITKD